MQNKLTGGIKNALEKGENIQKVKQSFLNAGYSKRDVDAAVAGISVSQPTKNTIQPSSQPTPKPLQNQIPQTKQLPQQPRQKKKFPLWLIILIIISILILIGAAIFGFFFDSIMQALFG